MPATKTPQHFQAELLILAYYIKLSTQTHQLTHIIKGSHASKHHAPPSINFGEFPITFPNRFCHGHDHRWLGWGKYCKYPNTCNAAYRLYVLGTALMMFPASMLMARVGRRNGFLFGAF